MFTAEENEILTGVGPGKPLHGVLAKFWYPVAKADAVTDRNTLRIRLLGENWVVARRDSELIAMEEHCPHRQASLALARVEEIGLGIICTTVVATVVFPRPLGPMLSKRILAWMGNASAWAEDVLGAGEKAVADAARLRLAADAVELRLLASNLAYDISKEQAATRWVIEAERRMVLLLPLLSSIGDRMAALEASSPRTS